MTENKSTIAGLTNAEVKSRVKKGLVNSSASSYTKSVAEIIFENVFTFFNIVNFILAGLIIYVGSYRNLLFMGVVISNIFLGIFQELKAKNTIEKLSLVARAGVDVVREGLVENIPDKDLVVDDTLILSGGAQIPVDAEIIDGELEVNESLLTGESRSVNKGKGDKLYSGSFVISGKAYAKALSVGNESYAGKLSIEAKKYKNKKSEIQDSLDVLIKTIAISLTPIGILLFIKSYYFMGRSLTDSILSMSAALIALIPGGLVLLVSMVFVLSVIKLSRHHTLVQEMSATETLARVDVLCLDKTGTLTEGKISLESVKPLSENQEEKIDKILALLVQSLDDENPTIDAVRKVYETGKPLDITVTDKIPFSSDRKYSGIKTEKVNYILGAPSFVLKDISSYEELIKSETDRGKRVLMLAETRDMDGFKITGEVKPLALLVFTDVVRKEARKTLDYFEKEGVKLKIISGDDSQTAAYIAGQAGLDGADKHVDATTLKTVDQIEDAIKKYNVFGRVTPEQKRSFVKALQKDGHTVAMTGDGVNDVLALKEADTSVAMASGSGAARAISSLVLLDSNFSSLPLILAEGRKQINNLERSASLYLSKTVFSVLATIFFLIVSIPYPYSPIQLTLINSVTIGIPSFVLALEPNSDLVQGRFFTNVMRWATPAGLTTFCGIVAVAFLGMGGNAASALSVFSMTFSGFLLIFYLCRPLNALRIALCATIWTIFLVAVFFFGSFFFIYPISTVETIYLALILGGELLLYSILNRNSTAERLAEGSARITAGINRIFSRTRPT